MAKKGILQNVRHALKERERERDHIQNGYEGRILM